MIHLEDDLHDVVDRVRASERMVEETRRLLEWIGGWRNDCPDCMLPTITGPRRRWLRDLLCSRLHAEHGHGRQPHPQEYPAISRGHAPG
jgi:hypothetical protein